MGAEARMVCAEERPEKYGTLADMAALAPNLDIRRQPSSRKAAKDDG